MPSSSTEQYYQQLAILPFPILSKYISTEDFSHLYHTVKREWPGIYKERDMLIEP